MEKFLIVDGNSILNRAFYGLSNMNMTNKEGMHTNAIYGFLNIYWMIMDKINPDYSAISFDLRAPTFRHKMYDQYKATRKKMPDELAEQMPIIKKVIRAMNIPIIEKEGYEADDILGTVANINTQNNIFTYILTGDKDSFQLISNSCFVVIPTTKMGKTEYTTYTPELLKKNQGILPYQVIHIKSLMGDSSDNIPGVKGIGEKTAYLLINEYTTLDNIYANIETLNTTQKIKEKLIIDEKIAFLSKDLATIDVNVPIEVIYKDCKVSDVNKQELYDIFTWLNFTKFLNKFDFSNIDKNKSLNIFDQKEIENKEKNINVNVKNLDSKNIIIVNSINLKIYKEEIFNVFKEERLSYLLTGIDSKLHSSILNLDNKYSLSVYCPKNDSIYIIDLEDLEKSDKKAKREILLKFIHSNSLKIGFNVKQDILYIFNNIDEIVNGFNFDLMIAYYLFDSNRAKYDINFIFEDLLNTHFEVDINTTQQQISLFDDVNNIREKFNDIDKKNISKYLKGLFLSFDEVNEKLKKFKMDKLFNEIEMPLTETLASMEHVGMYIDLDKLDKFNIEISSSIDILEKEIYNLADENFNINSPQQLGKILFEKLELPIVKKNKTGYSTDKAVLDEISDKHIIVDKIIEYRQLMKLKTTYVDGLKDKIAKDGRIHTTFMQTVASTGRLSSTEPNLQNIPIRLKLGSKIRTFFVAEDNNSIIDADYSQIELRVLAHISNDQTMIEAFKNNIDIHKVTASQVFNVELNKVTNNMRSKAKAVNFGIVYGISEFGLSKNISCSRQEAKEYIANYLEKYYGIKAFMENVVNEAKENGFVTTMFGRRRYIPELLQKNKNIIQFGKRIAMNTPIQGSAADIIKLAMNKIYYELKHNNLKSRLIMQVHDELIIETLPNEVENVKKIIYNAMEHIVKLNVPLDIDLNVGKSWYEAK